MNQLLNTNSVLYDSEFSHYDISVCIITYNKEAYIADAIESVFAQKTSCTYEIVVGDNASTDKTRDILLDYWKDNKDKVTLVFNNQNLGLSTNMFNTMSKAKGKYIIVLYGDDYWIDNERLQKQFDFLEANMQYVGVTAPIEHRYDGETTSFAIFPKKSIWGDTVSLDEYLQAKVFPMAGLMFRNDVFSTNWEHFEIMVRASKDIDDTSFCVLILMMGNIYIMNEIMGVYRCFKRNTSANNFNSVNSTFLKCKKLLELKNNLYEMTGKKYDFETYFGLTLATAWYAMIRKSITYKEFRELTSMIHPPYERHWIRLLFRGIIVKVAKR